MLQLDNISLKEDNITLEVKLGRYDVPPRGVHSEAAKSSKSSARAK
jgi:hypothetical protein